MSADTVSNARSAPLRICKRYSVNTVPDARSVPLRTSKDTLRTQCPTRAARPCAPAKILCEHSVQRAQRAPAHQQRYFANKVSHAQRAPAHQQRYFANTVSNARSAPLRTSKDTLRTQCPTRSAPLRTSKDTLRTQCPTPAACPRAPARIVCEHGLRSRSVPLRTSKKILCEHRIRRAQRAPAHQQEDTLRTQDPTRADEALRPQRCFANTVRFELVSECGLRSQRKFAT